MYKLTKDIFPPDRKKFSFQRYLNPIQNINRIHSEIDNRETAASITPEYIYPKLFIAATGKNNI